MKPINHLPSSRDERGAIMVMAVFMAAFLVAILYYAIGIGGAILGREQLQDAADAAALSGAVMDARGMNFLVLLNLVMAALLTVLVIIKALEGLAIVGMVVAAALAWVTWGASLAFIPPLQTVESAMSNAYDAVKPPVFEALTILHETANTVAEVVPTVTESLVLGEVTEHLGSAAQAAYFPGQESLPVEDDGFDELCGRAGEYAADLAMKGLPLPGLSALGLDSAAKDFTSSLSSWFCGDSGGPPPAAEVPSVQKSYPHTSKDDACTATKGDSTNKHIDDDAHSDACDESKAEGEDGKRDDSSGGCRAGKDCSLTGPYETIAAAAAVQCNPVGGEGAGATSYTYQARSGSVFYKWNPKLKIWVRQQPTFEAPVIASGARSPCGPKNAHPLVAVGYNLNVHPHGDVDEISPMCSDETPPVAPPPPPRPGFEPGEPVVECKFTEVIHILGCVKTETERGQVKDMQQAGGDDSNDKAPKRIDPNVSLGEEAFQVRAFAALDIPEESQKIMRVALWGKQAPSPELDSLRALGKYGAAQAEYFFDGSEGRGEWMWKMHWHARLRILKLPDDASSDVCKGTCQDLFNAVHSYHALFMH